MTLVDVLVMVAGAVSIAGLAWFFFKPRRATEATVEGGVQTVDITVKGGYTPSLIRVWAGSPVRLRFDRQESSDCTSKVVFPDFRVSKSLAAFGTTTVELPPAEPGEYGFACGMNMLHGSLVVEPQGAPVAGAELADDRVETARAVGWGRGCRPSRRRHVSSSPSRARCGRCRPIRRRRSPSCVR